MTTSADMEELQRQIAGLRDRLETTENKVAEEAAAKRDARAELAAAHREIEHQINIARAHKGNTESQKRWTERERARANMLRTALVSAWDDQATTDLALGEALLALAATDDISNCPSCRGRLWVWRSHEVHCSFRLLIARASVRLDTDRWVPKEDMATIGAADDEDYSDDDED